eukprot:CAMPEP_0197825944 /NCGR_PEP_ID=MMETSP1437-20131217/2968_1 /TAXON_ID=49252 ORGANISM="Eucampia antarctica, Strain CCMP1452" /NCGR_SAMPLE_ID=MMETSP1437 /ASSEMBLY_ACC=CAM_ASM_001096 /LENGTH=151 /DNA_ID=CAMNT_0043426169 /DNA_START=12 /DNA_END=467 /DNA_ORIENTATION=-
MHEDLRAKRAMILHSDMPSELFSNSGTDSPPPERIKTLPNKTPIEVDAIPKRTRVANKNNWHPKLKEALKGPLKAAGHPTFTKIMNFCKKDGYNIFPKGSQICTPNAFFGSCFLGEKCTKKHTQASGAQVKPILTLVEDFMKDPIKLNTGQ